MLSTVKLAADWSYVDLMRPCAIGLAIHGKGVSRVAGPPPVLREERQYTTPRAVIAQSCSTRLPRMQTYQSPHPNPPRSRALAGEG